MPFISIQLNSNRPKQIVEFFDNIEATSERPEDIEVLLHIDTGDAAMEAVVARETTVRKFILRVLQTDIVKGYLTLWKPLNVLFRMTDPQAYFVANLFDEIRFETVGWDRILRAYKGYYPDDIFRLRTSQFRFRNYTDFWQCGFAPDSSAFYTRRWLELNGDWNPCLGPDSFQQCVAFYMYTYDPFSPRQFCRDVPVQAIRFSGEGASIGLEGDALRNRMYDNCRAWFVLVSHRMQEEARRRAMLLNANIISDSVGGNAKNTIVDDKASKVIVIRNRKTDAIVEALPYGLSWLRVSLTNLLRAPRYHYFGGGGRDAMQKSPWLGIRWVLGAHLPHLASLWRKIRKSI